MMIPMNEQRARAYLLRLLDKRAYTSGQIAEKLTRKGASKDVQEDLIRQFSRMGYLDDPLYAERFIEEKIRKGYGERWIQSALRRKAVPLEMIREALSKAFAAGDEVETARKSLGPSRLKPKKGEEPRKHAARLCSYLMRRGFSPSISRATVQKALCVDPDDG